MDPQFKSTFIPKEPLTASASYMPRRTGMNLFSLLALVVFLSVLLLGVGLFLYEKSLTSNIDDLNGRIKKAKDSLELGEIGEYKRLDKRIEIAKEVVGKHLAVSNFFDLLEENTSQSVAFDRLLMEFENSKMAVTLEGLAGSFSSVAFQSDVIAKNRFFKVPVFSDFDLDESGNVTFKLTADLDPALISFERKVNPVAEETPEETDTGAESLIGPDDLESNLNF